jgi:hypothetical protein
LHPDFHADAKGAVLDSVMSLLFCEPAANAGARVGPLQPPPPRDSLHLSRRGFETTQQKPQPIRHAAKPNLTEGNEENEVVSLCFLRLLLCDDGLSIY